MRYTSLRSGMAETLILDRVEIKALVSPHEALEPMRNAFRLYSRQRTVPALRVPSPLPPPAPSDAGAMILAPGVVAGIPAYTVKVHAKHPGREPAIQGVIILSSLETGATLAILESGFLTALRTGQWRRSANRMVRGPSPQLTGTTRLRRLRSLAGPRWDRQVRPEAAT